jgi:hypothetical protein
MNKIDLIIDALECAKQQTIKGVMYPAGYHMMLAQALAAARELKTINAELLEALKLAQTIIGFGKEWNQIDAAIAKAGESK